MQNFDEKKLRPEESSSGFGHTDFGGNIFAGGGENPAGDTGRIRIDTNEGHKGTYIPPKKNNTWKWLLSFFIIFILLAVGTFFFLKNFINSPEFLNGKKGEIDKQITVKVTTDDSGRDVKVDFSPDLVFDTDSIVNSVLSKSKNAVSFSEVITKKKDGKSYYLNVNKQDNIITLESEVQGDDGRKQRFVRRIVVSNENNNLPTQEPQVQPTPKVQENARIEKKVTDNQSDNKQVKTETQETKKVIKDKKVNADNKLIAETPKLQKEIQTPEPDITKKYNFEKKFGKGKISNDIASNEYRQDPNVPSQEKQYASATPIFTIQVYSTPNLDDAKYWVSRLQQMNISTAYISKQKIRDITWYRVRFGEYPTREEARSAASKFGFSQLWIDRVK